MIEPFTKFVDNLRSRIPFDDLMTVAILAVIGFGYGIITKKR